MRERADVSGGRLEIWSQPGRGTRVSVRFHAESVS
jgi:signal transduction histidine kinase